MLGIPHNKRNREQKRENKNFKNQKSCIVEYTVSDRLKFLFSVLCSLFLLLYGAPYYYEKCDQLYVESPLQGESGKLHYVIRSLLIGYGYQSSIGIEKIEENWSRDTS